MTPRPPSVGLDGKELRRRSIRVLRSPVSTAAAQPEVVVAITLFNQSNTIARCLQSIVEQRKEHLRVGVVLLDDHSSDDWEAKIAPFLSVLSLYILQAECGTAALARNAILDWVDEHIPSARWVARLDADDRFTSPTSLDAAVSLGDSTSAKFVLGGNRLVRSGELLSLSNPAPQSLKNPDHVVALLRSMSDGSAENELPSCNLLLANRSGWRYPSIGSAEDHWLVSYLLMNHAAEGAILAEPLYCDYSLDGQATTLARRRDLYLRNRRYIYSAARAWDEVRRTGRTVLGIGQEGIVTRHGSEIEKRFYPDLIDDATVARLEATLQGVHPFLPEPKWTKTDGYWTARYACEDTSPASSITESEAIDFLRFCLDKRIVCSTIKRANFRRLARGGLMFIDIGKWLVPMSASYFLDSAARLFAISVLGWSDEEMTRRTPRSGPPNGSLEWLTGFADFYRRLMCGYADSQWSASLPPAPSLAPVCAPEVSLLIKACGMDSQYLTPQAIHLVEQLSRPRTFARKYLLLDPHRGPFLRQYAPSDWESVVQQAKELRSEGVIDELLIAPEGANEIADINARWFGVECHASHSVAGVPVSPQLWAFEQIATRFVLQCDLDALVGRRDLNHDYLSDMLAATAQSDVLGVAFNIPHAPDAPCNPYDAKTGDFVPEVRCGLLDLERLREQRPLPNSVEDGRLKRSWYRSAQEHQRRVGMRTLRGGDPRSFYAHPTNDRKADASTLARIRDLVGQGRVPTCQYDRWDIEGSADQWRYPSRRERLVFLAKGRNTPSHRIRRWLAGLLMQTDQDFGVVVIDDGSEPSAATMLPQLLRPLGERLTLIRNAERQGRIPNFRLAIGSVCDNPETLIAVVDLDDALLNRFTSRMLKSAQADSVDLLWGTMFRPDKPLKVYRPNPQAVDHPCAGDVWTHLRAFRKSLFDAIPDAAFKIDGRWIDECTDYATMVPMTRMAKNPLVIDDYLYFHERSTPTTPEDRKRKDAIIRTILARHAAN
ncbi:MAG: glycosyltransferase [Phycisphaerales bacterium]|nr:glycosyltransferase [Phycisphaerales bacterium]